jgi:hypothetical protein
LVVGWRQEIYLVNQGGPDSDIRHDGPHQQGLLFAMYFKREPEVAAATTDNKPTRMGIMEARNKLGRSNEDSTCRMAAELGIQITQGKMKPCDVCAAAKAKQKNVPKDSDHEPATGSDRRIFLDIATIKKTKKGPLVTKPNWQLMVDEQTRLKFSNLFQTKNGMVEPTCAQFHRWKQNGKAFSHVRMDGAGENKTLKMRSDSSDWKLNLKYEITARDTPQMNHLVELGFATLANRGRAMMTQANVPLIMPSITLETLTECGTRRQAKSMKQET